MVIQTPTATLVASSPPSAPPQAHQLDWFVGEWTMTSHRKVSADSGEWADESATSSVSVILDGHAVLETFESIFSGVPYHAVSLRTYNLELGKWEQRYKDSHTDGFIDYTGEFKDGEFVAYSNRSFKSEAAGGRGLRNGVREVFYAIELHRFLWRLERTEDEGLTWEVVWRLDYRRREG